MNGTVVDDDDEFKLVNCKLVSCAVFSFHEYFIIIKMCLDIFIIPVWVSFGHCFND